MSINNLLNTKPKATIIVNRSGATLLGVPWHVIADAVTARCHQPITTRGRVQIKRRQVTFAELQPDGAIVVPVGLLRRVKRWLTKRGYDVQIERRVGWPLLTLAAAASVASGQKPNALQRCFLQHARGQVLVPAPNLAAGVVSDVADLYPRVNVLVVTKNTADLQLLNGQLASMQPRRLVVLGEGRGSFRGDIVLATVATGVGGGTWMYPLAFYVGVEAALSKEVQDTYSTRPCRDVMRYMLRLPSRRLNRYEELQVETLFGPAILRCHSTTATMLAPRVGWLLSHGPLPQATQRVLPAKREAIWSNAPRNQLIAIAAQAIAEADLAALQQVGCQAAYEFLVDRSHPYDVAILVESLQHARHLQQLLPEWAIYGSQSKAAKVRRRAIVTETFAKQRGVPAQFVVRATGGTSDLPRRWLNAEVQLVIDLADAQCTATTARHQRYQELEYDVDPLPQEAGEA